ncbi:MAG: hypothetical protein QNJ46_31465 [Leptolyngbyaceae cyanobacterium MO_188.B28]|nr:hypothetical protein [Leptolyngbyaceae cyanobacterium MO_188.B28]
MNVAGRREFGAIGRRSNYSLDRFEIKQCKDKRPMNHDLIPFLAGVAVLILYLVFSALTEMGTKFPWSK